jgi:hypothetical protein
VSRAFRRKCRTEYLVTASQASTLADIDARRCEHLRAGALRVSRVEHREFETIDRDEDAGEFEDHGQRRLVRGTSFGAHGAVTDRRERAFDDVRRP